MERDDKERLVVEEADEEDEKEKRDHESWSLLNKYVIKLFKA